MPLIGGKGRRGEEVRDERRPSGRVEADKSAASIEEEGRVLGAVRSWHVWALLQRQGREVERHGGMPSEDMADGFLELVDGPHHAGGVAEEAGGQAVMRHA